ncbi:25S rRNA (adenine645-N1)-methyltransferase [Gurleya vavrai]
MYKTTQKLKSSEINNYHSGFETQTSKWPFKPLDCIIKNLELHKDITIADLGCGQAILEKQSDANVISIDINPISSCIKSDTRRTPLKNDSVDCVVFCLAIMNQDGFLFLKEANRICKLNGYIYIAEISYRAENLINGANKIGFDLVKTLEQNKFFVVYKFVKKRNFDGKAFKIPMKICEYKKR